MSHNIKPKCYKIPLISSTIGIGGIFLFPYLAFIPNQTFAESLIADPDEKRSLYDISTMQEMSQQICTNSREEETKQLRDIRDDKTYWVAKLKDGNCWMTQNLDFDIPSTLTDMTSDVDLSSISTGITKGASISEWPNAGNSSYKGYYDPDSNLTTGYKYYYNGPDNKHGINSNGCTTNSDSIGLASCSEQGFIAATSGDNHYLVGNYYSYSAATLGTKDNQSSGEATISICPKGWRLPTGGGINKDFASLMQEYGWQPNNTSASDVAINMNNGKGVYGSPLYFVYAGTLSDGALSSAGRYGSYWSSTAHSTATTHAHDFNFQNNIRASDNDGRGLGESVRCLAEGGGFPGPILDDNQANVSIIVSPVISIDVTKHADDMTVDFTQVARSSIIARVGSNQGYQVLISTEQSNLEQSPVVENQHIPMITTDQKISAGTLGWGIKKLSSPTDTTVTADTIYSPIGLGENKALFYTSNTPASEDLTFPVAIAVDSTLPSGKYSTQVTLTAVAM